MLAERKIFLNIIESTDFSYILNKPGVFYGRENIIEK
jgi:hypothetical protein